jgi:repressor LexA
LSQEPTLQPEQRTPELVFDYICAYMAQHGYAPTVRAIGRGCHLSPSTVVYNLDKLEAWGWLSREPRRARGLRILRG